jgi:hypothetical protein
LAVAETIASVVAREHCEMAKDKQKKHEASETTAESAKMRRKEFEKELVKLRVELTRLQTWVQAEGRHRDLRAPGHRG